MNKKVEKHYGWIYLLIPVQFILAILALLGYGFVFQSGTAGVAILVLLLLSFKRQLHVKEAIPLIFAFLCSICGDWFCPTVTGKASGLFMALHAFLRLMSDSYGMPCSAGGEVEIHGHPARSLPAVLFCMLLPELC